MKRKKGRAYWERHAKNYDRSMSILGGPLPTIVDLASRAVHGAERVLEVGAGTGLVTAALARSAQQVIATDYASEMVGRLRLRVQADGLRNVQCQQADLYELPFRTAEFDAVVAANVLHLTPDLPSALSSLRRVLKPGGRLIAPTYCHDQTAVSWVTSRLLALTGFPGFRRFTVASLREALEAAGVTVSHIALLPGLLPIGYVDGTFDA